MPIPSVQDGFRLFQGEVLNRIISVLNGITGGSGAVSVTDLTQNGSLTRGVQSAVAAGSNSQANATPITKSLVMVVTVSATTRAVRLPTAATGLTVQIANAAGTAVKVYPATGDKIGAGATNAVGTAIATVKSNVYVARDSTTWIVMTGA